MQLGVTLETDIKKMMEEAVMANEKAVTRAIRRAGNGLKNEIRDQVKSAGLGQRFANTIRANFYPERRNSMNAATFIHAAAKSAKDRFYTNIFEEGEIIHAQGGKWLAIPLDVAYVGSKRIGIEELKKRIDFRIRPTDKPGVALLVQPVKGKPDIPLFLLVKQVRIRKRIDATAASERWFDRIPDLIAEEMEKVGRK